MLAAMLLPVACVAALTEDWAGAARRAVLPELLLVCGLLVVHALPLLWRRRAPWAVFGAVLATAWAGPVAVLAVPLPSHVAQFLVAGTLVETLAGYAVAAYGPGAGHTWPAPVVATLGTAGAVTALACADGMVAGERAGPADAVLLSFLLSVVLAPVFTAVWGPVCWCAAAGYGRWRTTTSRSPAPCGRRTGPPRPNGSGWRPRCARRC